MVNAPQKRNLHRVRPLYSGAQPSSQGGRRAPLAPQGPGSPAATLSEQRAELADRALATLWAVWPRGGGTAGPGREWHS